MSAVCLRCGGDIKGERIELVRWEGGAICKVCERDYALDNVSDRELRDFAKENLSELPREMLLDIARALDDDFIEYFYSGPFVRLYADEVEL